VRHLRGYRGSIPVLALSWPSKRAGTRLGRPRKFVSASRIAGLRARGVSWHTIARQLWRCSAILVRFDQKKDYRELQTTNGGNMFTFKSGLSKDRMPDIDITSADASAFFISPRADLAPGEYLLSASSMGASGYDFGFHPR